MASLLIEKILHERKITDYLRSRNIFPSGDERGGKIFYRCPLHEGDNTPSFVVYTNSHEHENFYCFGCKARWNIIHLYRDLEKVTLGQAIRALGEGLGVTDEAELNHAVIQIQSDDSIENRFTPDDLVLQSSRMLYDFLKWVKLEEIDRTEPEKACDQMYKIIDKAAESCDLATLKEIYDRLEIVLPEKMQLLMEEKEKQIRERVT